MTLCQARESDESVNWVDRADPGAILRPGKAAPSARGGGLVPAAQATREATPPGRKSARERPGQFTVTAR